MNGFRQNLSIKCTVKVSYNVNRCTKCVQNEILLSSLTYKKPKKNVYKKGRWKTSHIVYELRYIDKMKC